MPWRFTRPPRSEALDLVEPVGYSARHLRLSGALYLGGIAMRSKRAVLIAGACVLLVPTAVLAHHALQVQFDMQRTITLTGAVTKMDWRNPHVRLYIEVRNEASKPVTWEL